MPTRVTARATRRAAQPRRRAFFACWYITAPAFAPGPGASARQALDNVTHTLVAATLARTKLSRAGRGTTAALVLASNAPDIDILATAGGALKYLEWHRGPTHGALGIVGLGLATAGLVWIGRRVWDRRAARANDKPDDDKPDAPFGMLVVISILGV